MKKILFICLLMLFIRPAFAVQKDADYYSLKMVQPRNKEVKMKNKYGQTIGYIEPVYNEKFCVKNRFHQNIASFKINGSSVKKMGYNHH